MTDAPLLVAKDIVVEFPGARRGLVGRRSRTRALQSVSVQVAVGETVGLVGESGSGKSTLAKTVLGLQARTSGEIEWEGEAVGFRADRVRRAASKRAQLVFQNPYASLDPSQSVERALGEVLRVRHGLTGTAARARIVELLDSVHLPAGSASRLPSEFSGGQRQRVVIARALAAEPRLLVCDEALSALDVSTQVRMLDLLRELRAQRGLALLFIGHDLGVVREISDRILVMRRGAIVEAGSAEQVYSRPKVRYTQALIASIPVADPAVQRRRREERLARQG